MNIKPRYRPGIRLVPGRYRIRVDKPGYVPFDQWIRVDSDRVLEVKLEPWKYGKSFRDRLRDGGFGPEMVVIPPGRFLMGSPFDEEGRDSDEGPQHRVSIARPFAIGRYEVTFEEYDRFCEATGRRRPDDNGWGRGKRPVINVSWHDAKAYARWLSKQTGKRYRLPSEAEWEYAARAGTSTRYWWGDRVGHGHANCDGCGSWWDGKETAPVGFFDPNPWGLYDTAGNVWEW
ncbi:MAG: PEGA domain-containing protein, partial [Gammaproteobacteria bacterium]